MGIFSTHFVALISILTPKNWKNEIINFKNSDFSKLLSTEDQKQFEVVAIEKILVQNLLLYIYTFNVLVDHRDPPQPWTLQEAWGQGQEAMMPSPIIFESIEKRTEAEIQIDNLQI